MKIQSGSRNKEDTEAAWIAVALAADVTKEKPQNSKWHITAKKSKY